MAFPRSWKSLKKEKTSFSDEEMPKIKKKTQ
jgi:hypothetical protein